MKRDQFLFLVGGMAFGILIGFGSYHAIHSMPELDPALQDRQATQAAPSPAPMGNPNAAGGAPMVARVNQLERVLQEKPDDLAALLELGNIHYDAAMWEQAAGYYERAVEIGPTADVLTDLGSVYRGLGRFDQALEMFDRAQELDPDHWQSLYNTIVVAVSDVRRADVAREAFAAMEAVDPRPPELTRERLDQIRHAIEALASGAEDPS